MIAGGTVISLSMLLIGTIYGSGASATEGGRWAIIVLIYVFIVGFTCSWAICTRIICSEIQPTETRAAVSSLGQCANWAVNWVIAFTTPLFLAKSSSGPYFLFGGCSFVTTLVCIAFQPETRGASLEDIDVAFEQPPWKALVKEPPLRVGMFRRRAHGRSPSEEQGDYELSTIAVPEVCLQPVVLLLFLQKFPADF